MNYESPYTIWWDKHIQGKYGVGFEIRKLMAKAFEGGRESRDAEIEALKLCELTDEEIMQVYKDSLGIKLSSDMILDFARAIIKKAREK